MNQCPDCECQIDTSKLEDGEIVKCPSCGLEFTYNKNKDLLEEISITGEDFGE